MVDISARKQIMEEAKLKTLLNGLGTTIAGALQKSGSDVLKKEGDGFSIKIKEESDPSLLSNFDKFGKALVMIYNAVKGIKIEFPKSYKVHGVVDVDSMPSVEVSNLKDLQLYFSALEARFGQLAQAISSMPPPKIEIPKIVVPSGNTAQVDLSPVLEALQGLTDHLEKVSTKDVKFPKAISIDNFPPQLTPQPVTNININALRGIFNSTQIVIGTSATKLPSANLVNRRALIVWNGSGSTIYLGGAGVASAGNGQGLPVLDQNYSPTFDAGQNMTLYGIVPSGTATVNVLEISNENIGG